MPVYRFVLENIRSPVDRRDAAIILYLPRIPVDFQYISDHEPLAGFEIPVSTAAGYTLSPKLEGEIINWFLLKWFLRTFVYL